MLPVSWAGWADLAAIGTHHTLVGLLTRVHPHVDEQLVAGIEGLVAAHAACPEAGEVLALALVNVALLDVPHQLLLLLVGCTAIHPTAGLPPSHHPAGQAQAQAQSQASKARAGRQLRQGVGGRQALLVRPKEL